VHPCPEIIQVINMDGNIIRSDKKMGLKPYFRYLLIPWLKPGAMDEKYFSLNAF